MMELWDHQKKALELCKNLNHFGFFYAVGTGKSATAIHALRDKCNTHKRLLRTLIICPVIVVKNWKDEFEKFSKIKPHSIIPLLGTGKDKLKTFLFESTENNELMGNLSSDKIFIMNFEALLNESLFSAIEAWQPEVLIVDESQRVKDLKAKRTKLCVKLAQKTKYNYLLSGTPVLNSPLDLFSQFLVLDKGATFGKNFFAFRARYFMDKNAHMPRNRYFPNWQIRPGALEEINQKISKVSMSVKKEECLDLPPLVKQEIKVEMTPEQRKMYLEMKQEFLTVINDEAVTATMALTKALRLMQIASGFCKTVTGKDIRIDDWTPKMRALEELLTDIAPTHKTIVWACWQENYAQIKAVCERLGLEYTELTGNTGNSERYKNVDKFSNDPKCRVLIGNPQAAGLGINLIAASYTVYYSRNFSLENELQSEARNYRGGSEIHEKITRIDLITENSIEELIAKKLSDKEKIGVEILRKIV